VRDGESGVLHRQVEGFGGYTSVSALATFLSPDDQQVRVVAGSTAGELVVYDPEAGSVLQWLQGHTSAITGLACIASSSAAPHHPRVVSASDDHSARVWDGETGILLADLQGHGTFVMAVAVWKEHSGGHDHDRIATGALCGRVRVWDGEAFTLLHELNIGSAINRVLAFKSAEGPARLLVAPVEELGLQVWDPEEGRRLHDGINRPCPSKHLHLFESAQGRHLLAVLGQGEQQHPRHRGDTSSAFLDVWDLGEAPARAQPLRPAHHLG
jgi:WD40 repeat protein